MNSPPTNQAAKPAAVTASWRRMVSPPPGAYSRWFCGRSRGANAHRPPPQRSAYRQRPRPLQLWPVPQAVPKTAKLAGQLLRTPSQVSAGSQVALAPAGRHRTPAGCSASSGQVTELPSQRSAASQAPAARRHTAPLGRRASAGQAPLAPLHCSTASQGPSAARHTVVLGRNVQVPSALAPLLTTQTWQSASSLPQLPSQHTPSAQKPLAHSRPI